MSDLPTTGELRTKILIKSYTGVKSSSGFETKTGSTFATVWAKREDAGGSEGEESGRIMAKAKMKFTFRYLASVTEEMKVYYEGEYYDIKHIGELGVKKFTVLITERQR